MKKYLFFLSIFILTMHVGHSQTNVSGGIYSNTTWTIANSPYIVVDTVVVFPGCTLTIEPGVTVKFNTNKRIEIRDGLLNAIGTTSDSIIFTSNSISPFAGIYDGVLLNLSIGHFKYCKFTYSKKAIQAWGNNNTGEDFLTCHHCNFVNNIEGIAPLYFVSAIIDSCYFRYNNYGINGIGPKNKISNSIFSNNVNGIYKVQGFIKSCSFIGNTGIAVDIVRSDSITECLISNNDTAIFIQTTGGGTTPYISRNIIENNNIGILLQAWDNVIQCNQICNNAIFNFKYLLNYSPINIANNYWCTNDSTQIASTIYDGYDNISLGLIKFMPIDTQQCYLNTGFSIYSFQNILFNYFPNPVSNFLTVSMPAILPKTKIKIINLLGEIEYSCTLLSQETNIDVSALTSGVYFIQIGVGDNISRKKFVKQ